MGCSFMTFSVELKRDFVEQIVFQTTKLTTLRIKMLQNYLDPTPQHLFKIRNSNYNSSKFIEKPYEKPFK